MSVRFDKYAIVSDVNSILLVYFCLFIFAINFGLRVCALCMLSDLYISVSVMEAKEVNLHVITVVKRNFKYLTSESFTLLYKKG